MPIDFENITDHTGVRIYNFEMKKRLDKIMIVEESKILN